MYRVFPTMTPGANRPFGRWPFGVMNLLAGGWPGGGRTRPSARMTGARTVGRAAVIARFLVVPGVSRGSWDAGAECIRPRRRLLSPAGARLDLASPTLQDGPGSLAACRSRALRRGTHDA